MAILILINFNFKKTFCFLWALFVLLLGLSNDVCDPEDNASQKMNIYFIFEFRDYLDLFNAPICTQNLLEVNT